MVSKNGKIRESWDGEGIEERRQIRRYTFHSASAPWKGIWQTAQVIGSLEFWYLDVVTGYMQICYSFILNFFEWPIFYQQHGLCLPMRDKREPILTRISSLMVVFHSWLLTAFQHQVLTASSVWIKCAQSKIADPHLPSHTTSQEIWLSLLTWQNKQLVAPWSYSQWFLFTGWHLLAVCTVRDWGGC